MTSQPGVMPGQAGVIDRLLARFFGRPVDAGRPVASAAIDAGSWQRPIEEELARLETSASGLASTTAAARLVTVGPNDATTLQRSPLWLRFLGRFTNPLVLILLFASALSAAAGDITSLIIVAFMILVSVGLDFFQEVRAENAVDALRRTIALRARVKRDGRQVEVPVDTLVPGDVVTLSAGDLAPADCRLIESKDLFVNQALLTGEPYPVEKAAGAPGPDVEQAGMAANGIFMGTSVVSGSASVVVCATGRRTAFGQLAGSLLRKAAPTAFELGIRRFGILILRLTVLLTLFVLVVNVLFHRPFLESVMFALALAVGLTPELLPMVTTVTLARGATQLARRKVIVKRLAAMHNIGAMDTLCTDKTGTLTEANIRFMRCVDPDGRDAPVGQDHGVFELLYLNSFLETGIRNALDDAVIAHRTLDVAAWKKLDEVPFDFQRRRVSVLVAEPRTDRHLLIVKGAPEEVIRASTTIAGRDGPAETLTADRKAAIEAVFARLSADGFRVIGVATRVLAANHGPVGRDDETDLAFVGFAVFLDPPKASAGATITALARDGVAVRVLTGDNEAVTRRICEQLAIPVTGLVTGQELRAMSEEALIGTLRQANVFCRVSPDQKLRILLALQRSGHVVGFLGDGINDAAAIHAADVGISVDGAADVAREAADVILLEHDLGVVHDAVMEGRRSVTNVTKYILMGTSSNFGNMFSMAGAALFLPFLPMLPIQVLLNNLLYDFSETALPFDSVDPEAIEAPVHWDMHLIERFMLVIGPVSSIFDFITFFALSHLFAADEALFQTGWFVESLATQVLVVFVIRTRRHFFQSLPHAFLGLLSLGIVAVGAVIPFTPVGTWFGFVPLPPAFFVFLVVAVGVYVVIVELVKQRFYGRLERAGPPPARP